MPPRSEEFDPFLSGLSSVDEVMNALDTAYPLATPIEKLDVADELLRRRFFHSYSYFRFDQDWSAAALRPIWDNLASPVRPDDILQFRRAACSQQSIVFAEVAKRLGFTYASVGLPNHFMAGVLIQGQWWVYDANKEVKVRRYPFAWLKQADPRLARIYTPDYAPVLLAQSRKGQVSLHHVNTNPAPQATLLHKVTKLFSHFGWMLVLGLWAMLKLASLSASQPRGETMRRNGPLPRPARP